MFGEDKEAVMMFCEYPGCHRTQAHKRRLCERHVEEAIDALIANALNTQPDLPVGGEQSTRESVPQLTTDTPTDGAGGAAPERDRPPVHSQQAAVERGRAIWRAAETRSRLNVLESANYIAALAVYDEWAKCYPESDDEDAHDPEADCQLIRVIENLIDASAAPPVRSKHSEDRACARCGAEPVITGVAFDGAYLSFCCWVCAIAWGRDVAEPSPVRSGHSGFTAMIEEARRDGHEIWADANADARTPLAEMRQGRQAIDWFAEQLHSLLRRGAPVQNEHAEEPKR